MEKKTNLGDTQNYDKIYNTFGEKSFHLISTFCALNAVYLIYKPFFFLSFVNKRKVWLRGFSFIASIFLFPSFLFFLWLNSLQLKNIKIQFPIPSVTLFFDVPTLKNLFKPLPNLHPGVFKLIITLVTIGAVQRSPVPSPNSHPTYPLKY